jgi:hypothetical protein
MQTKIHPSVFRSRVYHHRLAVPRARVMSSSCSRTVGGRGANAGRLASEHLGPERHCDRAAYRAAGPDRELQRSAWCQATPLGGAPHPSPAGTAQSFTLPAGTHGYVAIRAVDAAGNVGLPAVIKTS